MSENQHPAETSLWSNARKLIITVWVLLARKAVPELMSAARLLIRAAEREVRAVLFRLADAVTLPGAKTSPASKLHGPLA